MNIHTLHFGDFHSVLKKLELACPYLFMEHFDLETLDQKYLEILGHHTSSLQLKEIKTSLISGTIEIPILKKIIEIEINALSTSMNSYGLEEGYYTIPRLSNDSKDLVILSELSTLLGITIPSLDSKIQELITRIQEHTYRTL